MKHAATQVKLKILENQRITPEYGKLSLKIGNSLKVSSPGQFFNIRCSDKLNPLLRRPFSLHRVDKRGRLEILYEIIGKATKLLSKKKTGDTLDVIGPLGNGFPLPKKKSKDKKAILVAGGMGIAPLLALAEELSPGILIIGAKTKEKILCEKDFKKLGFEVLVATEDGSKGKRGLVTELLKKSISNKASFTIYACGPNAMLKEVAKIAKMNRIDIFGSFEEHMSCGVGSCYGCVIKTKKGYKRICCDGPVFNLGDIAW